MYHEAWRLMRDNFWRADMAGVDWPAMGDRYRPLLDRIGSADDLHDVLRELHGESRTSHTGVLPPAAGGDPALAQGLLGADVEPAEDGTWRIARILPGESSVIGARSPLAAPGVAAAPGDLIVAVDGRPVDPDLGPNALLVGKADKPGGVISCYFNELVDGTLVTQPTSALWFADAGWGVDNHGVDPDVEVIIAPHDWAAGRDPQLDTAVQLALQALEQRTPAAPPTV